MSSTVDSIIVTYSGDAILYLVCVCGGGGGQGQIISKSTGLNIIGISLYRGYSKLYCVLGENLGGGKSVHRGCMLI